MDLSDPKPLTTDDITHEQAVEELRKIWAWPSLDEAQARAALMQECAWLARNGHQTRAKRILAAFDAFAMAKKRG